MNEEIAALDKDDQITIKKAGAGKPAKYKYIGFQMIGGKTFLVVEDTKGRLKLVNADHVHELDMIKE